MTDPSRIRVGVVYGGRSSEHAISCVSAGSILRHLDPDRFEVVAIGIARDGSWLRTDVDPDALAIADGRLPEVSGAAETPLARAAEILASVDVVFPILHGPYGEDGTIQGLLEMAGLPYVGAGVLASAAGMDKEFAKKLMAADGLPIGDYLVLRPGRRLAGRWKTLRALAIRCSSSPRAAARRSASAGSPNLPTWPRRSPWPAGMTPR